MYVERLTEKVENAAKWSSIAEISVKIVTPITNMILARILAPEIFGVVATVYMLVSFVDMFTDAGFQKYLIQHEFKNAEELGSCSNVAFWTNLLLSLLLWIVIIMLRNPIAAAVGNPKLGGAIAIASVQLPITSFSTIQMSLYRRRFDFKTLFYLRIVGALIPLFITVPLAYIGAGYWSIIAGSTCGMLVNAIILTVKSKWKPNLFYKINILVEMISFSIWSLLEAVAIWLNTWIDIFIISRSLAPYYLGLYKNSINMVNGIMVIITATMTPIMFSALSRLQNDNQRFKVMFLSMQKILAYFIFPLGAGMFLYDRLITGILLGSKWSEAAKIIGIWGLVYAIRTVMTSIYSEAYRSKGKPKLSLLSQIICLTILIPGYCISIKFGFWPMVYTSSMIRLEGVVSGLILMKCFLHFNVGEILQNVSKPILCTLLMGGIAICFKLVSSSILWVAFSIPCCIAVYVLALFLFSRKDVILLLQMIKIRKEG